MEEKNQQKHSGDSSKQMLPIDQQFGKLIYLQVNIIIKLKFYPSPYVVLRPLWTTTLIRRLSDGFCTLYNNDSLNKYSGADLHFATVPTEIKRVLLHTFQDFLSSDLTTIAKFDDF